MSVTLYYFLTHQFKHASFEYPQHMFWMRNKENRFQYALLSRGLLPHCMSYEACM